MKIPYNPDREKNVVDYFSKYPNGNNICALWKKFGYVTVQEKDGKVDTININLMDMITQEELGAILMNCAGYFNKYEVKWFGTIPKRLVLTPKEEIKYSTDMSIIDKTTTKTITQKEMEAMQGKEGFIKV